METRRQKSIALSQQRVMLQQFRCLLASEASRRMLLSKLCKWPHQKGLFVTLMLLFSAGLAFAQTPCTKEEASQKVGTWIKEGSDNFSMADRSFPKAQYPLVLRKADQTIALLEQATPGLKGLEARAYRSIRDGSYTPNGALPFAVTALFLGYYCVPDTPAYPEERGKIRSDGETGTWIYIDFNSLGWLDNERMSLGKDLRTTSGEMMFFFPKQQGEFKGYTLLLPRLHPEKTEAVIITSDGRVPFKPVTREQFLRAREKYYQDRLNDMRGKLAATAPVFRELEGNLAQIAALRAGMSPAELQSQAIIRDQSALPPRSKVFVAESEGGRRLVTIDRQFFNPSLPRYAVQFITVYWRWQDEDPAKAAMIRQFKSNFDFQALRQMLDR